MRSKKQFEDYENWNLLKSKKQFMKEFRKRYGHTKGCAKAYSLYKVNWFNGNKEDYENNKKQWIST